MFFIFFVISIDIVIIASAKPTKNTATVVKTPTLIAICCPPKKVKVTPCTNKDKVKLISHYAN